MCRREASNPTPENEALVSDPEVAHNSGVADIRAKHTASHTSATSRPRASPYPFGDVFKEVQRRATVCGPDWTTALQYASKTLSAAFFMFFATLFSTVALGALIEKRTGYHIGLSEYLAMNSVAGVVHSLFGAQPLLVLRPTGPITAILGKLYDASSQLHVDFNQFLLATGICVALLMSAVAAFAWSRHITRLTPFTHDVFGCFVCSIYVTDGVTDVMDRFNSGSLREFAISLYASNLALLTFGLSAWLAGALAWTVLPPRIRLFLSDYAVTIAVVATTLASYAFNDNISNQVHRIALPESFGPTCFADFGRPGGGHACVREHDAGAGFTRRPWLTGLPSEPSLWLYALLAAVPITFFFYMDQNISSLLCQLPEMQLRRGHYYHAPFVFMAAFNGIGPMFGCPFVTGSLPHSPQFVRALALKGQAQGELQVAESRVAPLLMYVLVGLPLLAPTLLAHIPEAAIDGILAYVGYEGIVSTGLWSRVVLFITPKENYPPRYAAMESGRVHLYTLVQLSMLALCWVVNLSPYGLCVAFVIVALVPLRELVLPHLFSAAELESLDTDAVIAAAERDDSEEGAGLLACA